MRSLPILVVACLSLALVSRGSSTAPLPVRKEKASIVGTWEVSKGEPLGGIVEFSKDGKLKMTMKLGDTSLSMDGSYSVEGEILKVSMKGPDGKERTETIKITKLTDKELVTEEKKGDKADITEFKKK